MLTPRRAECLCERHTYLRVAHINLLKFTYKLDLISRLRVTFVGNSIINIKLIFDSMVASFWALGLQFHHLIVLHHFGAHFDSLGCDI